MESRSLTNNSPDLKGERAWIHPSFHPPVSLQGPAASLLTQESHLYHSTLLCLRTELGSKDIQGSKWNKKMISRGLRRHVTEDNSPLWASSYFIYRMRVQVESRHLLSDLSFLISCKIACFPINPQRLPANNILILKKLRFKIVSPDAKFVN